MFSKRMRWTAAAALVMGIVGLFASWSDFARVDSAEPPPRDASPSPAETAPALAMPNVVDVPVLRTMQAETSAMHWTAVSGRIVDRSRTPLSGARIDAFHHLIEPTDLALQGCELGSSTRLDSVVSDAAGRFEISEVPQHGTLHFVVSQPGFAVLDANDRPVPLTAATAIDVGDLVLERALSVSFHVLGQDRRPIADAVVSSFLAADRFTARTDSEGRCVLERLTAGAHAFLVQAEGYAPEFTEPKAVTLLADAPPPSFTVELEPLAEVEGLVVDPSGAPIEGAEVRAEMFFRSEIPHPQAMRMMTIARTRSAADGSFELRALIAGSVTLFAIANGFRSDSVSISTVGWRDRPPKLIVDRSRWLEVEVVDRTSGARVEPDSLLIYGTRRGASMSWIMGSAGGPEIANMQRGDRLYRVPWGEILLDDLDGFGVSAEVPGYRSGDSGLLPFPVVNEQLIRVNVSRGRVVSGTTAPGAEVVLIEEFEGRKFGRCALADRAGRFRFERVTIRGCSILARVPDRKPRRQTIAEDRSASDVTIDLPLDP